MLKMVGLDGLFNAVGNLYWLLAIAAVCVALWKGKTKLQKLVYVLLALALFIGPLVPNIYRTIEYHNKLSKAQALFEERCKTAGEKIYRTVDRIESIKLINPRPILQNNNWFDRNWFGAGIPHESNGEQYILNFLFYDVPEEGNAGRYLYAGGTEGPYGSIAEGVAPEGTKGYSYVEVHENGVPVQYSLKKLTTAVPSEGFGSYGVRSSANRPTPLYAVVYENIADPEGRANWIAGARVSVKDLRSEETLAEFIQYSFEAGFGSRADHRTPWIRAKSCEIGDRDVKRIGIVRFFVQKVLKPIQGS